MIQKARRVLNADTGFGLFLLVLNVWIAWRLFFIEYVKYWGSIEGVFMALARFYADGYSPADWFSWWQLGMPVPLTYVPLLHLTSAKFIQIFGFSPAHAYHATVATYFSIGATALYAMCRVFGASPWAALISGLVFSVFSPSALLIRNVAADLGGEYWGRRLQVATVYGEGPHIAALGLMCIATALVHRFAVQPAWGRFAAAALASGAVMAMNTPGTMGYCVLLWCWCCAERDVPFVRKVLMMGAVLMCGYLSVIYLVPPVYVLTMLSASREMHAGFGSNHSALWLGALAAGIYLCGRFLLKRLPLYASTGLLTATFFGLVAATADGTKFELLPQGGRMHLEFELGASIVAGAAVAALVGFRRGAVRWLAIAAAFAAVVFGANASRQKARYHLQRANVAERSEYQTARWLHQNVPGQLVYATGSSAFWLNAWSDNPQFFGCCEQGMRDGFLRHFMYLMNWGTLPEHVDSIKVWLKVWGVRAVIANGERSSEYYKDFRKAEKFRGHLPVLAEVAGDIIYQVPVRSHVGAYAMRRDQLVREKPVGLHELQKVAQYARAMDDPAVPALSGKWDGKNRVSLWGDVPAGHVVSFQTKHADGWRARVGSRDVPVGSDAMGFLVVEPGCAGPCKVDLEWTGLPEQKITPWVSAVTLLGLGAGVFASRRRLRA